MVENNDVVVVVNTHILLEIFELLCFVIGKFYIISLL